MPETCAYARPESSRRPCGRLGFSGWSAQPGPDPDLAANALQLGACDARSPTRSREAIPGAMMKVPAALVSCDDGVSGFVPPVGREARIIELSESPLERIRSAIDDVLEVAWT